jgi:hypothetical protein
MIPFLAALVAFACAAASARRLWFAANATALHPDDVLAKLGRSPDSATIAKLRASVQKDPTADWERDLFAALATPNEKHRIALVNEQLTELDLRIGRWSRVPRVCASIATSFGFLLATLVLRQGLADSSEITGDMGELIVRGLVGDALTVAAMGVVGTAFCIGAHSHAKRMTRDRLVAADKMVERLEASWNRAEGAEEGEVPAAAAMPHAAHPEK